jgi:hypothetical protein
MADTDQRIHTVVERLDPGEPAQDGGRASALHRGRGRLARAARWYLGMRDEYTRGGGQDDERPLTGYTLLSGGYLLTATAAAALVARRRRGTAELPGAADFALLSVAVFRTTRTISKDSVTSHMRAPFTVFAGSAGSAEVLEQPRSGPVRHAVGELLTCPFCLGQWVGTAALVSFAAAPRPTRWVATLMTLVAASDLLQFGYATLKKAAE